VAVDDEGNVAAAGYTFNTGTNLDFAVVKFDRAGTLLWRQTVNGTPNGYDVAMSVAVDNEGNVVAAGSASNSGVNSGFTVAKFDREGASLWQQTVNGGRGGSAYSLAVDSRGNVAAAGYTNNGPSYYDFMVVKFDADGTLLWQQTLNGTGNYFDTAFSVALDNQGNTVAGGWTNLSKDPFPGDLP